MNTGKMLVFARTVCMPMSYLYGKKSVGPITGLVRSLRQELYTMPYHEINWAKARNKVAKVHYFMVSYINRKEKKTYI